MDYLELLCVCRSEPLRLIERVTIKVSRFYRHAPTFDCLRYRGAGGARRQAQGRTAENLERRDRIAEKRLTRLRCCSKRRQCGNDRSLRRRPQCVRCRASRRLPGIGTGGAAPGTGETLPGAGPIVTAMAIPRAPNRCASACDSRSTTSPAPACPLVKAVSISILCRNLLIYLQFATQERALGTCETR